MPRCHSWDYGMVRPLACRAWNGPDIKHTGKQEALIAFLIPGARAFGWSGAREKPCPLCVRCVAGDYHACAIEERHCYATSAPSIQLWAMHTLTKNKHRPCMWIGQYARSKQCCKARAIHFAA
jgi:hypothetical protein